MGNLSENIRDGLSELDGKPAHHVTHALKTMSGSEDGTMIEGLQNMLETIIKDKQDSVDSAKITYSCVGFLTCVTLLCVVTSGKYLWDKKKNRKAMQTELNEITQIIDDEIAIANSSESKPEIQQQT